MDTTTSVLQHREEAELRRLAELRASGKMKRIRVVDLRGIVLGSMEHPGYNGGIGYGFRLIDGNSVAFAYAHYEIDEENNPFHKIDFENLASNPSGFRFEIFTELPDDWVDRASELPGWVAVKPRRIIDLKPF